MSKTPKVSDLVARKNELEANGLVCFSYMEGLSEQIRRVSKKVGIRLASKPTW